MGSLCCVAARPHGSNTASRDWSVGPHEPYWRTNTSFSPPPSRWDFPFQPEAVSFNSHDGIQFYGSSGSSNSRDSRGWARGNNDNLSNNQFLMSDGISQYLSSPINISPGDQWTPPAVQEISNDDFVTSGRGVVLRPLYYSPAMEGTSAARNSRGSTSSRSDSSCDYEPMTNKSHPSSQRNRRYFMPKAIHPLSFPSHTPTIETNAITTPQTHRSSSSLDFAEAPELSDRGPADRFWCSLCERLLSQRSPWGSRRIIKSGDMPVSGVLACGHVFHAECLDQTTPKSCRNDPPCPVCARAEEESCPKSKNGFPWLRHFSEDAPTKPWGCMHAGDCVDGALHGPSKNTLMSLKFRKNLSLRGNNSNNNVGREFPGKLRKSGSYSPQLFVGSVDPGGAGSSRTWGLRASK